jgi:hypothetical protein
MKLLGSALILSSLVLAGPACKKKEADAPAATKTADKPATPGSAAATTDKAAAPGSAAATTDKPAEPAAAKINIPAPTGVFACKGAAGATAPASKDVGGLPFAIEACPVIPPVYGKLTWGMTAAEFAKAAKGAKVSGSSAYIRQGKLSFHTRQDDTGHIYAVYFDVGEAALAAMVATWGAPQETEWLGDKRKVWWNPAAKTKATVKANTFADDESDKYQVEIAQYLPMADFLGEAGPLGKTILGVAGGELQKALPDLFTVESDADAAAKTAALGLDPATANIVAWAGADKGKATLEYPAFEASSDGTVTLEWEGDKVASYRASFQHGKNPTIKAEIPAVVAQVLGAPTSGEQSTYDQAWTYVFTGKGGEKIELRESSDWWMFEVSRPATK